MLGFSISIAIGALSLALIPNLWRLFRGPSLPDRIMALDTLYINAIALLVLYGIQRDTIVYFDIALLIALMGFVATAALCKYLLRGDIIE